LIRGRFARRRRLIAALAALPAAVVAMGPAGAQPTSRLTVDGTELVLTTADGRERRSRELVGAVLTLSEGGASRRVRIDAVERDSSQPDVWLHRVAAQDPATGAWGEYCAPDPQGRRLAIALASGGSGQFQLTCTAGAVAKCIRMGYLPWRTAPSGASLAAHHAACVHLLRADYCGDDRPATRDGTLVDVFDREGIQRPEADPALAFEAAWSPHGAVCVARTRIPELLSLEQLLARCPRLRGSTGAACTADPAPPDALLFNRSRPLP
jgi:hypothetical protein